MKGRSQLNSMQYGMWQYGSEKATFMLKGMDNTHHLYGRILNLSNLDRGNLNWILEVDVQLVRIGTGPTRTTVAAFLRVRAGHRFRPHLSRYDKNPAKQKYLNMAGDQELPAG